MDHYSSLKSLIDKDVECHYFDSLESTSSFLSGVPYSLITQLCVTREQTQGKVQHVRHIKGITLSGGERRRVEIARALAMDPKFILLDEPFAGIDPISVGDIQEIIYQLRDKGIGILITDHNYREMLDTCNHSYVLSAGKIIAQGGKDSILANEEVKRVYLGETAGD